MELACAGWNTGRIAEDLHISSRAVARRLADGLAEFRAQAGIKRDELVAIELARLNELYEKAHSIAMHSSMSLAGIDRCLRIMERRAKLLGLDAPDKIEQLGDGLRPVIRVVFDGQEDEPESGSHAEPAGD